MRASHSRAKVTARFDDQSVVTHAGLLPLLRLTENIEFADLAADRIRIPGPAGANPDAKLLTLIAGMAAGADSIDDLDVLRTGANDRLFTGIRAPSTLGTFLRGFDIGHTTALDTVAAQVLTRLARTTGGRLLPGIGDYAIVDLDSKITRVHGPRKVGANYGYTHVRGYNFLAATLATPIAAPVILATRLRGGQADTRRHATSFLKQALRTARGCGATGNLLVRGDSGYYVCSLIHAITAAGARFSITLRQHPGLQTVIAGIDEHAWTPITYATPVFDEHTQTWIHTAQVAETRYTAFTNPTEHPEGPITARLIVRRYHVETRTEQGELFPVWRYQAVFTDTGLDTAAAEQQHRGRAGTIEAVFADLNNSALAHFPSGQFHANQAWLTLAALTHNLLRGLGVLASRFHAWARTGTIRRQLIAVPARLTRTARTLTLRLPQNWPWQDSWHGLFTTTTGPPPAH
ncbi:IS1380 family transposase [Amycolatopsis sp. NPDC051061]|uniref:IS1380 family transposase n=1 Tax=Amycolatopsis sp. NPDC051061 TaxID=3155042 RepID=UPI0034409E41